MFSFIEVTAFLHLPFASFHGLFSGCSGVFLFSEFYYIPIEQAFKFKVPTSSEAAEENRKVNFSLILHDLASSESQFFKKLIGLETTLMISIIYESNICFCFLLFFVLFVISNVKL